MSTKTDTRLEWASASPDLYNAYSDFLLSRKALLCSERTIARYAFTLGRVMEWMVQHGVSRPSHITGRQVRAYLSDLSEQKLSDYYIHNHARTIRTLLRFFHNEGYISEPVTFKMPAIVEKRFLCLTADDVAKLVKACDNARDKALISLMVDTGLRSAEVCALNWGDVQIASGLVRIAEGKGGKARSVVVGIATRRALLAYQRELRPDPSQPLFQTRDGERLTIMGLRSAVLRVGRKAGVKVTPHALQRTFATLSLKAGMNPLHLQELLGHATMEMTNRYIHVVDDDLVEAHQAHGPVDNLLRSRKK